MGSVNEIVAVWLLAAKLAILLCPHAGGLGLCEMVQHISILDFDAASGSGKRRVTEYIDHLHEHFTDPGLVANAVYLLPTSPGYSTMMGPESIAEFRFPGGTYWAARTESEFTKATSSTHAAQIKRA